MNHNKIPDTKPEIKVQAAPPEGAAPETEKNGSEEGLYNDALQAELAAKLKPLSGLGDRKQEIYRPLLKPLHESGLAAEECYKRLLQLKVTPAKASEIKRLLSCPEVAEALLDGRLSWKAALEQVRKASPSPWKKSPEKILRLAIGKFVKLLRAANSKEYHHSAGVFRLVERPVTLGPTRKTV